jgi:hypothetical protein
MVLGSATVLTQIKWNQSRRPLNVRSGSFASILARPLTVLRLR